jgi:hypothetical protein
MRNDHTREMMESYRQESAFRMLDILQIMASLTAHASNPAGALGRDQREAVATATTFVIEHVGKGKVK